jgi:hypothetical protein
MKYEVQRSAGTGWFRWSEHPDLAAALSSALAYRGKFGKPVRILEDGQEIPENVLKDLADKLGLPWRSLS